MRISFYTLGCKLNQAETDELKKDLVKKGFIVAPFDSGEDIAIIRACGVTCNASQTAREIIRRAKRQGIYVIATGCLENKDLKEIDFVGKNNEEAICHCEEYRRSQCDEAIPIDNDNIKSTARDGTNRTRAFIKIQTGCDFHCSYCLIPSFRGQSQSVPEEEIINKINEAVKDGYKEVVLTGVNICLYQDLTEMLTGILQKTKIQRLRLGSLDPRLISPKLINLYCHSRVSGNLTCAESPLDSRLRGNDKNISSNRARLMSHWHLSLQSGSDTVLKRMNRRYTAKQYLNIVKKLRKHNPLFSFTTDVIVGFPGETTKEFEETCEFIKKVGFAKIHIFPFSPRPGTSAARLKPITNRIVSERVKKLTKIADKIAGDYEKKFIGLTRPVLFENIKSLYCEVPQSGTKQWEGYAPEYVRVKYKSKKNLRNSIIKIKIR